MNSQNEALNMLVQNMGHLAIYLSLKTCPIYSLLHLLIASKVSKKTHSNPKKPKFSMKIKKWSQWWHAEQHLDLRSVGYRRFSRYQENKNLTVEVVSVQNSSLLVVTIILFFYKNKRNLPKKVPENSPSRVSLFAGYEKHFMISWLLIRENQAG